MGACASQKQKSNKRKVSFKGDDLVSAPQINSVDLTPDSKQQSQIFHSDLTPKCSKPKTNRNSRSYSSYSKITIKKSAYLQTHSSKQFSQIYTILNKSLNQLDREGVQQMLAQDNRTGVVYQMEVIQKNDQDNRARAIWLKEQIPETLKVLKVIELFQEPKTTLVIKEFCGGPNLEQLLNKCQQTPSLIFSYIVQILEILEGLHEYDLNGAPYNLAQFQMVQMNSEILKFTNIDQIYSNQIESKGLDKKKDLQQVARMALELCIGEQIQQFTQPQVKQYINKINEKVQSNQYFPLLLEMIEKIMKTKKDDYRTIKQCLASEFVLNVKYRFSKEALVEVFQKVKRTKVNYFQFCIVFFMINKFCKDQIKLFESIFQQIDTNQSGMINKMQFEQYCQKIQYKGNIKLIYETIDINEDENIDLQEFLVALVDRSQIMSKENIKITFTILQSKGEFISLNSILRKIEVDEQRLKGSLKKLQFKKVQLFIIFKIYYSDFQMIMQNVI